jgi:anti-anti-sigma regulatory factor
MTEPSALPQDVATLHLLLAEKDALLQEQRRTCEELRETLRSISAEGRHVSQLNEFSHSIGLAESESEFYQLAARHTTQIFPNLRRVSVAILNSAGDGLVVRAIERYAQEIPTGTVMSLEGTQIGAAVRERRPVVLGGEAFANSTQPGIARLRSADIRSVICTPLISGGRAIGTLNAAAETGDFFGAAEVELLMKIAALLAVHVERWNLVVKLQTSLADTKRHELELQHELAERRRAEQERLALQEQIIAAQQRRLEEMSTPMIPITDTVMIMPIIGTVDSARARQILESGLEEVRQRGVQTLIMDITGMQRADHSAAEFLIKMATALRLLGARLVLTGIRPEVAQALIGRGISLDTLATRDTLQSAIADALARSKPHRQH